MIINREKSTAPLAGELSHNAKMSWGSWVCGQFEEVQSVGSESNARMYAEIGSNYFSENEIL